SGFQQSIDIFVGKAIGRCVVDELMAVETRQSVIGADPEEALRIEIDPIDAIVGQAAFAIEDANCLSSARMQYAQEREHRQAASKTVPAHRSGPQKYTVSADRRVRPPKKNA